MITVLVNGDTGFEAQPHDPDWPYPPGEGFNVNLSDATNSTLVDAQGLGWIVNDD